MTIEELRIAVAKELGWKFVKNDHGYECGLYDPTGKLCCCWDKRSEHLLLKELPHFTTSRDACWEGWEKDAPPEYFSKHLWRVVNKPFDDEYEGWIRVCKSTAEQRCRAMLKWKGREAGQ